MLKKTVNNSSSFYNFIIFNGDDLLEVLLDSSRSDAIKIGDGRSGLCENDFLSVQNKIGTNTIIYIYAHGRVHPKVKVHQILLYKFKNEWINTSRIFEILGKKNVPLNICLMSCYAGAITSQKLTSGLNLPIRSFVGLYAPADSETRREVNKELIEHSIVAATPINNRTDIIKNLWLTSLFINTSFIYRKLQGEIKYFEQKTEFSTLRNTSDLITEKSEKLTKFNNFLINFNFNSIIINHQDYTNWYKDLWFMSMVERLKDEKHKLTTGKYLEKIANDDLKSHKSSLFTRKNMNLLEYFKSWPDTAVIPYIETAYKTTVSQSNSVQAAFTSTHISTTSPTSISDTSMINTSSTATSTSSTTSDRGGVSAQQLGTSMTRGFRGSSTNSGIQPSSQESAKNNSLPDLPLPEQESRTFIEGINEESLNSVSNSLNQNM